MVYIDTSALVPVFMRESKSEAVIAWLESSGERLVISEWSLVEFASAAAMKVRTRQVEPKLAKQAMVRAREFAQKHCTVVSPGRAEFARAAALAGDDALNLRAGDALHLAIAASLNVRDILCLDAAMVESARLLGINAVHLA
jgi:predicted nucleic acid-binding protein